MKITQADRELIRNLAINNLYFFEKFILDYKDMTPRVHGRLCRFLQNPAYRKKQVTLPRGFLKTTTSTIGRGLWHACVNPNIRMLIVSSVVENARKMVGAMQRHIETNPRIRLFFPEVVPDNFNKVQWSGSAACVNRTKDYPEATWEAIGVGGSVISRHYDHIIEDDLIYPKQDDLTGAELMPNRDDIEKAIGWHKLAHSLLIDPGKGCIDNVGTRWAPYDLISYIRKKESGWKCYEMNVYDKNGEPQWPERFSPQTLQEIESSQGPYMFSTQYLCKPVDPSSRVFQTGWLQNYHYLPPGLRYTTTVDLAQWDYSAKTRNNRKAYNVILTCGMDFNRHLWIARIDRGHYTPTEVVEIIAQHKKIYNVEKIGIETVYYQKAILQDVKRFYERTGIELPVTHYSRDNKTTKDARIRGLQPIAANGCLHVRADMRDFLEEYADYPVSKTVDILDALSDQLKLAKPPEIPTEEIPTNIFDIEEIVTSLRRRGNSNYGISSGLETTEVFFNPSQE